MNRTITSVNELTMFSNIATSHKPFEGENKPISWTNWNTMGSAGATILNVDDMLKWCVLHLNHGQMSGKTYFSQDIQEDLWNPHNSRTVDRNRGELYPVNFSAYGLGFVIYDFEGEKVISHGGGYDSMYPRITMVPELNLGIMLQK